MTLRQYADYWSDFHSAADTRLLYLKDWHYFKLERDRGLYSLPSIFSADWLNEFWDMRDVDDDFRFMYLGPAGTWTPLHVDVYHSYSWSANIYGRKRWWLFPPGNNPWLYCRLTIATFSKNASDIC
ncbi:unnamed protein product [Protopolystoma xenopodis]|uniref:Jumonji domain-containing protein 4 n=1 Tax=Protopolystoma xenopodis TaxID=117903 RepID=A0A3S5BC28_9PLAT|nr:unnamed protein product [Protopolystoma xenopodis]